MSETNAGSKMKLFKVKIYVCIKKINWGKKKKVKPGCHVFVGTYKHIKKKQVFF